MTGPGGSVDPSVLDAVDRLFADRVAAGTAPSSVWGVFDADGLVASGGHGDRGDGASPDDQTVYRIASCTKSVTAATLLHHVERGDVHLDAPVTEFVPAFRDVVLPSADAPVPTLRMLLTMSGGFPTDDPWADRQEPITDEDLDGVLRDGLLFDSVPGTRFAYSNLGYALLGRVIAVVAGRPYRQAATDLVLEPLGLGSTAFAADDVPGFVVTGARRHEDAWEPLPLSGPGAFSPIGGLFSTVADLAAWGRHLASACTAPSPDVVGPAAGTTVDAAGPGTGTSTHVVGPVSRAGLRSMQQVGRHIPAAQVPSSRRPTGYGYGLFVEEDPDVGPIVSHSGGYPGFSAHMRWSTATGLGVVAFENATQAKVSAAAETAHDLVLAAAPVPDPLAHLLPQTRAAQAAVRRLLAGWDDLRADEICTPNVALDVPYGRRRTAIAHASDVVAADPAGPPVREASTAPSHLRWWVAGARGQLRIDIRLAPLGAGLVQTLTVTAEPADA